MITAVFSGALCGRRPYIEAICRNLGWRRVCDADILSAASRRSGLPSERLERAFSAKTSAFNPFTRERERAVAHLKLAVARRLQTPEDLLLDGRSAHLIPRRIGHVLRICLIAGMRARIERGIGRINRPREEIRDRIAREEENAAAWVKGLSRFDDPWDAALYDLVLPTDKLSIDDVVSLVRESSTREALRETARSRRAVSDFLLSASVEAALADAGHHVDVGVRRGDVTLTVNRRVLMASRLEAELEALVGVMPGVEQVQLRIVPEDNREETYRRFDPRQSSKILLVDDERDFVQTLSERLLLRDMGSVVVHDGASALEMIAEDAPEVMVLDLKMPGVDGMGVLEKVKAVRPETEVIILTGHGSDANRRACMNLGAFAYLEKPVDVQVLGRTIQSAHEKVRSKTSKSDSQAL